MEWYMVAENTSLNEPRNGSAVSNLPNVYRIGMIRMRTGHVVLLILYRFQL